MSMIIKLIIIIIGLKWIIKIIILVRIWIKIIIVIIIKSHFSKRPKW